jgi:hypothetical protein
VRMPGLIVAAPTGIFAGECETIDPNPSRAAEQSFLFSGLGSDHGPTIAMSVVQTNVLEACLRQ